MLNPFSIIIAKLLGKEDKTPELTIEELQSTAATPHIIKELEIVRNQKVIPDDTASQRVKRRRQSVRRNSNNNS